MSNQLTDAGRNPLYEGLFEGETQGQRNARLAAARNGGTPAFEREDRYIVIKRKDLNVVPFAALQSFLEHLRALDSFLPRREFVVVESDWPEYETVWRMIEARVTGQAGSMVECPHRCGSVFAKESYGAGFIEGSGMCPACDATMPVKDIVNPGDEPTPPELLAAKLIDTWRAVHGRPVPWEKAVEITAIATSMSNEERERLLAMADAPVAQAGQVPDSAASAKALVEIEAKKYSLNAAGMFNSGAPDHRQTIAVQELLADFDDDEAEGHWEAIMAYSDLRASDALFHAAELLAAAPAQGGE